MEQKSKSKSPLSSVLDRIERWVINIITPLMPYMPLVIAFAQKYEPRIGLGTLLTLMPPYSIAFAIGWTALLVLWLLLGIPLGPGSGMVYPPV